MSSSSSSSSSSRSSSSSSSQASFSTKEDSKFIDKRRSNIKSDLIEITEDKLENILLKHLQLLSLRKSWITPLFLTITVLLAILSATFEDKLGIRGSVWEAFFLLLGLFSFIWLLVAFFRLGVSWKKGSMSNLISIIKNADQEKGR